MIPKPQITIKDIPIDLGRTAADIVKTIFKCPEVRLPTQRVQPLNGTLTWLLDNESASMLSKERSHESY